MSSFRRKGSGSATSGGATSSGASAKGWKPSVNNSLGLVSCGHKELDDLLGGGLNLGTMMMVNSDIHSNHADTLITYMLAESLSMGHATLLVTADADMSGAEMLLGSLPFNRTLNSTLIKEGDEGPQGDKASAEHASAAEAQAKAHLKVAWQYAKYIKSPSQKSSHIVGSHYCCSYDLAKRLQGAIMNVNVPQLYCAPYEESGDGETRLQKALDAYLVNILSFITPSDSNDESSGGAVARVFLHRFDEVLALHGETASPSAIASATSRFFTRLRVAIRCKRVVVVMSACPAALPACLLSKSSNTESESRYNKLVQWAHSALTVETFAGRVDQIPAEFSRFCAFLEVVSIQHLGTLVPRRPLASRFGLLRDRRKLHIEPLHLPPEESRAQGSSGTDERLEAKAERLFGQRGAQQQSAEAGAPVILSQMDQTRSVAGKALSYEVAPGTGPNTLLMSPHNSSVPVRSSGQAAIPADAAVGSHPHTRPHHDPTRHTSRGFKRLNLNASVPVPAPGKALGGVNISSFSSKKAAERKKGIETRDSGVSGCGGLDF